MPKNAFSQKIKTLIAKDDLNGALNHLKILLDNTPLLNEVIHQSGRFYDIQKQIRLGVIDYENASVSKNKIRKGLLDLLSEIDQQQQLKPAIKQEFEKAISIINSKNVVVGNITASGDITIGDTNINESKTSQRLKFLLYFLVPILAIGGTFFWHQYQSMQQPLLLKVFIENQTPNNELPEPHGTLSLIYGDKKAKQENVNQAYTFEGIPANFKQQQQLRLTYTAKGFITVDTLIQYQSSISLQVKRNNDLGQLKGKIADEFGQPLEGVVVSISCCKTYTDATGAFELLIPFAHQKKKQRIDLFKENYQSKSTTTPIIGGEIFRDFLQKK